MNPADTSESCWRVLNLDGHKLIRQVPHMFYISIALHKFIQALVQCMAMNAVHIFAVQVLQRHPLRRKDSLDLLTQKLIGFNGKFSQAKQYLVLVSI